MRARRGERHTMIRDSRVALFGNWLDPCPVGLWGRVLLVDVGLATAAVLAEWGGARC